LRVLLDHNLDRRLKQHLPDHEVSTTFEMGWADLLNGELLTIAQEQFDVMLTSDTNIQHQQNLTKYTIAIIVFRAFNNRLATHAAMMGEVNAVLLTIQLHQVVEVLHEDVKRKLNP
jgi:predicted nuclease of predicted toxin-antitoxin system